jgi:hypothetical protein
VGFASTPDRSYEVGALAGAKFCAAAPRYGCLWNDRKRDGHQSYKSYF